MNELSREELLRENEELRAQLLHEIRMANELQREKDGYGRNNGSS